MNFCSQCGAKVVLRIPQGEDRTRYVCDQCGVVHYQNPKLVVGCVPELPDGRILICKRAIEPRVGYWTIPAGFMENGETLQQAAARESMEEALAQVEIGSLLTVVHITPAHQVHVFFRARLLSEDVGAGPESLDVRLVQPHEIPWEDIAFPSTEFTLQRYLEDRKTGAEHHHFTELTRRFR
jgi:ADP-ribose pyrophosphatase YjhB (NUDIX family)